MPSLSALSLCLLPFLGLHERAPVHPQDGPDVDLRVRIDERAVRVQIVVNLAFADEIVDAPREDAASLHELEYDSLHDALFEYFRDELVVEIDGVLVKPVDEGFEVQPADVKLLPLFPGFGTRALTKARLALDYAALEAPQRVRLVWPAYPPDYVQRSEAGTPPLEVTAELLAGGESSRVTFTRAEPEHNWHADAATYADRFLPVPAAPERAGRSLPLVTVGLLALLLSSGAFCLFSARGRRGRRAWALAAPLMIAAALTTTGLARVSLPASLAGGAALPDEAQAVAIFRPLHANIYRAFDYEAEGEVYDALAQSVTGELLDGLYSEIHHSLVLQEEGGAVARVQSVTPLETTVEAIGLLPPDDAPGFTVRARWRVEGAVFHFGHEHWRTNEYLARYSVRAGERGWRIAESQVLEAQRVEVDPAGPAAPPVVIPDEL